MNRSAQRQDSVESSVSSDAATLGIDNGLEEADTASRSSCQARQESNQTMGLCCSSRTGDRDPAGGDHPQRSCTATATPGRIVTARDREQSGGSEEMEPADLAGICITTGYVTQLQNSIVKAHKNCEELKHLFQSYLAELAQLFRGEDELSRTHLRTLEAYGQRKQLVQVHEHEQQLAGNDERPETPTSGYPLGETEEERRTHKQMDKYQEELVVLKTELKRQHDLYEGQLRTLETQLKQEREQSRIDAVQLESLETTRKLLQGGKESLGLQLEEQAKLTESQMAKVEADKKRHATAEPNLQVSQDLEAAREPLAQNELEKADAETTLEQSRSSELQCAKERLKQRLKRQVLLAESHDQLEQEAADRKRLVQDVEVARADLEQAKREKLDTEKALVQFQKLLETEMGNYQRDLDQNLQRSRAHAHYLEQEKESLREKLKVQIQQSDSLLKKAEADSKQFDRALEAAERDKARVQKEKADAETLANEKLEQCRGVLKSIETEKNRQMQMCDSKLKTLGGQLDLAEECKTSLEHQLSQLQEKYGKTRLRNKKIMELLISQRRSGSELDRLLNGHLCISFESAQQERNYQGIAKQIITKLDPKASIDWEVKPDRQYDLVLHLARTEGGRTVNLKPSIRQQFKCENVILVLLRSGTNQDVYSTFVPHDPNEYSGIMLGKNGEERRVILQLLHWQNQLQECTLNQENLKLLGELVSQACPKILENIEEQQQDQLLRTLREEEDDGEG